jgi:YbbR domain-containing protein
VGKVYVSADVKDISLNYHQQLTVKVADKNGLDISQLFTVYPATAEVTIGVIYKQPEKYVAVKPVITGEPAPGFKVSHIVAEPATIRVFGDLAKLETLDFVETAPIDISGLDSGISQTVSIVLPDGFSAGGPKQVTVFVEIEPVTETMFAKGIINADNVAEGLSVLLNAGTVMVTASGPESFIKNLTEADIVIYVDCTGLEAGIYDLPLQALLPANISLVSIEPRMIRVEIR